MYSYLQNYPRQSSPYSSQVHSQILLTLHRQIQSLTPMRLSYQNLQHYHNKITCDLETLIQEHEYTMSNLKANLHILSSTLLSTETQRNAIYQQIKSEQQAQAKLALEIVGLKQKFESLNEKLALEQNRNQQNSCYRNQLEGIANSIQAQIENIKAVNSQLNKSIADIKLEKDIAKQKIQEKKAHNQKLSQANTEIKDKVVKINIQNQDQVDCNRKFEQELVNSEAKLGLQKKLNRDLEENLKQLNEECEKAHNQSMYKKSAINSEEHTLRELNTHYQMLKGAVDEVSAQLAESDAENLKAEEQLMQLQKVKSTNLEFKLKSQGYLAELKQANQLLLTQMEQFCIKDRQVQDILCRKMESLNFFSKTMCSHYEKQANLNKSHSHSELHCRSRLPTFENTASSTIFFRSRVENQSQSEQIQPQPQKKVSNLQTFSKSLLSQTANSNVTKSSSKLQQYKQNFAHFQS